LARTKYFILLCNIQPGSGAHPASCIVGTGLLSKGWCVLDVIDSDKAPASTTKVENVWIYISASQHGVDRDKFRSSSSSSSSFCCSCYIVA
jgi:hypothetical protein